VTSESSPYALSPLLSPANCRSADLAAAFARFPEQFLHHHPGYARVRPALLPLMVPKSLARTIWRTTATALAQLTQVLRRHLTLDSAAWMGTLGYSEDERTWLQTMTDSRSLEVATAFARADFVIGVDGPRLVEINVGPTIGGIGVMDRYSEVFEFTCRELVGERLAERISMPRPAALWSRILRRLACSQGSVEEGLRIALVVADDEADIPHPHEAAWYLRREGIMVDIVHVDALRFCGARAETPSGPVDLVYACFTYDQLRMPVYRQFAERAMACHRAGGPLYVSPPVFTLFGNKAMLSYLAHDTGSGASSLLLRTRRLEPELHAFASANRTQLVLKPAIGYGGDGVMVGADCTPSIWKEALDGAAEAQGTCILQDYVEPVPISMPTSEGPVPYNFGIGCLAFGGRFGGLLLRQTPATSRGVTNCKQGATFATACVVDDGYPTDEGQGL
jgi:hypothetical protein